MPKSKRFMDGKNREIITSAYSTPKKASTVLTRAKTLIEEGNWCQGKLFSDKDKFCSLGAIGWCAGADLVLYWQTEREYWDSKTGEYIKEEGDFLSDSDVTTSNLPAVIDVAVNYLAKAIDPDHDFSYDGEDIVIGFNDNRSRRRRDVVKKFEQAIELARKDGK